MGRQRELPILISEETDFKTETVIRDKEGHYIMVKWVIQKEHIIIINAHAPIIRAPRYISKY